VNERGAKSYLLYAINLDSLFCQRCLGPKRCFRSTHILFARATIDYDSVPAKIVNVTHVISSHGSDFVSVDYSDSLTSGVAPAAKVRVLSEFAIPIEVVFTVWLIELLRAIRSEGVSVVRLPAILLARAFFVLGLTWESYEFIVRVDYYRHCVAYL
jgi:hypothetical protein